MGAADLVPGVSGGTMALILGIYGRLIGSIRVLTVGSFWQDLVRLRFQAAIAAVDGLFLSALGIGILSSILLLSGPIETALNEYPIYIWSFFSGLVLASTVLVGKRVNNWNWRLALLSVGTAGTAFGLVGHTPAQTPESWWFILFSGALAVCAMILPGVSGSYILVLLGKYQYILAALNQRDLVDLVLFLIGGAIGLLSFARGLSWLLNRYSNTVLAALSGLLLGSLRKIWPWQGTGPKGRVFQELFHLQQFGEGQLASDLTVTLAFFVLGLGLVLVLSRLSKRFSVNTIESSGLGSF